jgi:hypothetical protein
MLETVTLQRIPSVAARRHPLRRVITRPRPDPDMLRLRDTTVAAAGVGFRRFGLRLRANRGVDIDSRVERSALTPFSFCELSDHPPEHAFPAYAAKSVRK